MRELGFSKTCTDTERANEPLHGLRFDEEVYVIDDPIMVATYDFIRRLAISDIPVLFSGETGVGKDHAARALHHWSRRTAQPFVVLNCAAVPETLIESELFGYRKGAFSGATEARCGLLEAASGGSLFLDEVGELSDGAQAKLLRATEAGHLRRLGESRERSVDVRLVSATNRDLSLLMEKDHFRRDLFFRLTAATVTIPALRLRPRDILPLSRHFLAKACRTLDRSPLELTEAAERVLLEYRWPGNVRELKNLMELVAATSETIYLDATHLTSCFRDSPGRSADSIPPGAARTTGAFRRLADEIAELERLRIEEALKACRGVQAHAARLLDIPLRTFANKLRRYGLRPETGK